MVRHIFIGTFKEDVPREIREQELKDLRAMKENIPCIVHQEVGFSTGWDGPKGRIVMTVDLRTKEDFEEYMRAPYHAEYISETGRKYFDTSTFVSAQFEFGEDA